MRAEPAVEKAAPATDASEHYGGGVRPAGQKAPRSAPTTLTKRHIIALGVLLLVTFAKGLVWAVMIAPLDAPDEPSHFNYIVQVREGVWLPVVDLVSPGGLRTPPSTPLNQDVRDWFARYDYKFFRSMPYESAQPPLFYWSQAIWTRPVAIDPGGLPSLLQAARALSVLYGVGAVFSLWLACLFAFGAGAPLTWFAPTVLTLSPTFTFTTATVSNDAGAAFWGAVLLAVWSGGLASLRSRQGALPSRPWILAVLAGLVTAAGILTKLTFVVSVPATALWVWFLAARGGASARQAVGRWVVALAAFGATALIPVLPWVLRNLRVYGEPTGARAIFDLIHRIYWDRQGFSAEQVFTGFPPVEFVHKSFRSLWALFGWATVSLDAWIYWVLALLCAVAFVGGVIQASKSRRAMLSSRSGQLALVAVLSCAGAAASYLGYNSLVEFQPHMRYTFMALAPGIFLLTLGLSAGPWPRRVRVGLSAGLMLALLVAQIMSLFALSAHSDLVLKAVRG